MLLLAVSRGGYARTIRRNFLDVDMGIYVDDRMMWAFNRQQLYEAKQLSKTIDTACGRKWNAGKGLCFTTSDDAADKAWCDQYLAIDCGERKEDRLYLGAEFTVAGINRGCKHYDETKQESCCP